MPSGLPLKWEVSFLLIQADAASRHGLILVLGADTARNRARNHPSAGTEKRDRRSAGVNFVRPPSEQPYGTVAVFQDLYGNLWDLLQYNGSVPYRPGLA